MVKTQLWLKKYLVKGASVCMTIRRMALFCSAAEEGCVQTTEARVSGNQIGTVVSSTTQNSWFPEMVKQYYSVSSCK